MRTLHGFEIQELRFAAGLPHLFLNPGNLYQVSSEQDLGLWVNPATENPPSAWRR